MQDHLSAGRMRELAAKCRRLAGSLTDDQAVASLLELAALYQEAADAEFDGMVSPFTAVDPPADEPGKV